MTENNDHNWDTIYKSESSVSDGRTFHISQASESEKVLRKLFPRQSSLSDCHQLQKAVSGREQDAIRSQIPTLGLALLSEAAADKVESTSDTSVEPTMCSNPNSQIPLAVCSGISVPKYPHPGTHLLKTFKRGLTSSPPPKQVPVTASDSYGDYSERMPYNQEPKSKFKSKHPCVDNIFPNQTYLQMNKLRSQAHMTSSFLSSSGLMPSMEQPFSDAMEEGFYRRGNETSPNSLSSPSVGPESQQSSCDSWDTLSKNRRSRSDSNLSLDIEVMDLQDMSTVNDKDLRKVVSSLSEEESIRGTVMGSCGTSPSSSSSPSSPSSQTLNDRDPDVRNNDGEVLQKISKSSGVFRTKYFPDGTSLKIAQKSLRKVLPHLKHKQPSATVSSSSVSSDQECDAATVRVTDKIGEDVGVDSDVTMVVDSSTGNSEHSDTIMKKEVFCQVCGDIAAGFYCGAYICEACKKFFVRASRQEKIKYVCHKSESCTITKETRVRCQYCRYQKCVRLNMYSPGKETGAAAGISNIPCRVCGGASSGFHFGALTCEGCKGFFRRMAKEREWHSYKCSKENHCEISMLTRNVCKACRYRKCLEAGMSVEASRIGRQPNAIKHAISVEARKQENLATEGKQGSSDQFSIDFAAFSRAHSKAPPIKIKKEMDMEVVDNTIKLVKEAWKELSTLHNHDKICYESYNLNCDDLNNTWRTVMVHFEFNAKCIIKFSKKLPKFQTLCIEDQVSLIQMATYSLCILNHSQFYNLERHEYRFFDFTKEEEKAIVKYFPPFSIIPKHFRHFGTMLKTPNFDDTELAFLSSLVLLNTENLTLKDMEKVDNLKGELLESLQIYIERNHTNHETRMGYLLLRISELAIASLQHNQCVGAVAKANPQLENQLWEEMYLK